MIEGGLNNNLVSGLVSGLGVSSLVVWLLDQLGKSGQHASNLLGHGRRSGEMVTLGLESVLVGSPSQSDALSFGRDVVRGSLVGGSVTLGVRLVTGGAIRTLVADDLGIDTRFKKLDSI